MLLRVSESWLRRRAGRRQIPCTFLGKHLRFSAADLAAIIAAAAEPATGRLFGGPEGVNSGALHDRSGNVLICRK